MGFFWAILCGFAFGMGDTLIRLGVRSGTPFTGAIISSSTMVLLLLFPVLSQDLGGRPLWPAIGWYLAMGAAATAPGRLLFYFSLRRIGVSRASILVTISPLLSMLFAVAFLGERPTGWVVLGAILIFLGVLSFTMEKTSIRITPAAALLGLLPTVFFSMMPLFMRIGMRSLPNPVLGTFLAGVGALAVLLAVQGFLPRADRWGVSRRAFGLFVAAGFFYTAAFFAFYEALGSESVSFVAPLVFTSPLFAMLVARLFFRDLERVTWKLAAGGVVVFLGVVAISLSRGG